MNLNNFCGRNQIVDQLMEDLNKGECRAIIGPERIGKTALLRHLEHKTQSADSDRQHEFIYVSCRSFEDRDADYIYRSLSEHITDRLNDTQMLDPVEDERQRLEDLLKSTNRPVAILLDDFEKLAANTNLSLAFFNFLRSLHTHNLIGLTYCTASKSSIRDEKLFHDYTIAGSPFFNVFAEVQLKLFYLEEARNCCFLRDKSLSDQMVDFLLRDMAGPHPYLLQIADRVFQSNKGGSNDLLSGSEHLLAEFEQRHDVKNLWKWYWKSLNDSHQQDVCKFVATGILPDLDTQYALIRSCVAYNNREGNFCLLSRSFTNFVRLQSVPGLVWVGDIFIEEQHREVYIGGKRCKSITGQPYQLLRHLALHAPLVVSNEQIEQIFYNTDFISGGAAKDSVKRLRTAIKKDIGVDGSRYVVNSRGTGYSLKL